MKNIKDEYGHLYRISRDESATIKGQSRADRDWLYQIPAKYGHIYMHDKETLGAYCNGRKTMTKLIRLPKVELCQWGERECSVKFPPEAMPEVAALLKARKRRKDYKHGTQTPTNNTNSHT